MKARYRNRNTGKTSATMVIKHRITRDTLRKAAYLLHWCGQEPTKRLIEKEIRSHLSMSGWSYFTHFDEHHCKDYEVEEYWEQAKETVARLYPDFVDGEQS